MAKNIKDEIQAILEKALGLLQTGERGRGKFTSITGQTEWNLAHHLATVIAPMFEGYACDVDVTKAPYGNQRPDIIVHKRGPKGPNHLVIEVKRKNLKGMKKDIEKLHATWFARPLCYRFGAVVNLTDNGEHTKLVVEENPNFSR